MLNAFNSLWSALVSSLPISLNYHAIGYVFAGLGTLAFLLVLRMLMGPSRRVKASIVSVAVEIADGDTAMFVVKGFYAYAGKVRLGEFRHVMPPEDNADRAQFDRFARLACHRRTMKVIVDRTNPKLMRPAALRLKSEHQDALLPKPAPLAFKPPSLARPPLLPATGLSLSRKDDTSEPERDLELALTSPWSSPH